MDTWREESSLHGKNIKRIWFVGGGPLAREVLGVLRDIQQSQGTNIPVVGFLDNLLCSSPHETLAPLGEYASSLKVLPLDDYMPQEGDAFVLCMGKPHNKHRFTSTLLQREAKFLTLIHPTARIGYNCRIGTGSCLYDNCIITTNVMLDRFVHVYFASYVTHDVCVGEFTTIMTNAFVGGRAKVGAYVSINTKAFIAEDAVVEDYAIVGVASVLLRKACKGQIYFGSPAVSIGKAHTS